MPIPTFTWPDWRNAKRGTRFRINQTGRTGTYIQPARGRHNGAIVVYDDVRFPVKNPVLASVPNSVFLVAPAREATPIEEDRC